MKETLQQALEALRDLENRQHALSHAMGMLSLDAATVGPKGAGEGRGQTLGVLSDMYYALIADPKNEAILSALEAGADELDPQARRETELVRRQCRQISRIPQEEYVAYTQLLNQAQEVWEKAKNENDFPAFAPYLEKLVEYNRKFAGYYNPDLPPYDALLNEYEEGMTTEILDAFFARLREKLVPLIARIGEKPAPEDGFLHREYPVELQRKYSDDLMELMGLDRRYCVIGETEHPFTENFNNRDVRITTHYYENDLGSSMYSVIHEGGHALYELDCDSRYNYTAVAGGVSMGIHESQSRFYENIVGRSLPFVKVVLPIAKKRFPDQLQGVDAESFYRAVNRVQPSLIRTEADEMTYCLHIMVRYELEKQLIAGTLAVRDVPQTWNRLYREYLGIEVPDDAHGCLQDSHWSGGAFGYFPSYALGSAYGAQMLAVMEQQLGDFWAEVEKGDLSRITGWLREKIHRHASLYRPSQLFEMACGKFNPDFYVDYLTRKYTDLYQL